VEYTYVLLLVFFDAGGAALLRGMAVALQVALRAQEEKLSQEVQESLLLLAQCLAE
jgi:hypothetical protein